MQNLSPRLLAVSSFVRKGSFMADVGTDHAYLPVYLAENGTVRGAVATDIAKAPLERAKADIENSSAGDIIATELTPGLCGIEKYAPDDICICGMGAETVIQILQDSEYVKNDGVRLILQPMTKAELLRKWLFANGFDITKEGLCVDREKLYQIIVCSYTSVCRQISDFEALVGGRTLKSSEFYARHLGGILKMLDKKIAGLGAAASPFDLEGLKKLAFDVRRELENAER